MKIEKNIDDRPLIPDYEDYTEDLSFLKQLEIPLLIRVLKEQDQKNIQCQPEKSVMNYR